MISGPLSYRVFRETGPWRKRAINNCWMRQSLFFRLFILVNKSRDPSGQHQSSEPFERLKGFEQ